MHTARKFFSSLVCLRLMGTYVGCYNSAFSWIHPAIPRTANRRMCLS